VDICGYELPTNMRKFTQKDFRSENIPKSFRGLYFSETPCTFCSQKKSDFIFLLTSRKINEFEGKFQVYIVAERMPIHLETSCLFLNILCK